MVRRGFDQLHLEEVWAEALTANVASLRVLQKVGMRWHEEGEAGNFVGQPTRYQR